MISEYCIFFQVLPPECCCCDAGSRSPEVLAAAASTDCNSRPSITKKDLGSKRKILCTSCRSSALIMWMFCSGVLLTASPAPLELPTPEPLDGIETMPMSCSGNRPFALRALCRFWPTSRFIEVNKSSMIDCR